MTNVTSFRNPRETYHLHLSQLIVFYFASDIKYAHNSRVMSAIRASREKARPEEVNADPLLEGSFLDLSVRYNELMSQTPDERSHADIEKIKAHIKHLSDDFWECTQIANSQQQDVFSSLQKKRYEHNGSTLYLPEPLELTEERVFGALMGTKGSNSFRQKMVELELRAHESKDRALQAMDEGHTLFDARSNVCRSTLTRIFPAIGRLRQPDFLWDHDQPFAESAQKWLDKRVKSLAKDKFGGQEWVEVNPVPKLWNEISAYAEHYYDLQLRMNDFIKRQKGHGSLSMHLLPPPNDP